MRLIFSIIFFLVFLNLKAQISQISKIEQAYIHCKQQINRLKTNQSTDLYCLQLKDNIYNTNYPVVGKFRRERNYYYVLNYQEKEGKPQLLFVEEYTKMATIESYREWFYIDEELSVVYEKEIFSEASNQLKAYCKDNYILHSSAGNTSASTEIINTLISKGLSLIKTFDNL